MSLGLTFVFLAMVRGKVLKEAIFFTNKYNLSLLLHTISSVQMIIID